MSAHVSEWNGVDGHVRLVGALVRAEEGELLVGVVARGCYSVM